MKDDDLHLLRKRMQGAQNFICFAQEYFSPKTEEIKKEKILPLIKKTIPHANASMEYLRTFIPSSHFRDNDE